MNVGSLNWERGTDKVGYESTFLQLLTRQSYLEPALGRGGGVGVFWVNEIKRTQEITNYIKEDNINKLTQKIKEYKYSFRHEAPIKQKHDLPCRNLQ